MFTYYMPTKVFFGKGCIAQSGEVLADLGRKALLVTGRHSAKVNGSQAAVVEKLGGEKIDIVKWSWMNWGFPGSSLMRSKIIRL